MIAFDEAIDLARAAVEPLGQEQVSLSAAAGRYLAQDVIAGIASPRTTVSAMDGYAVRVAEAIAGAALQVIGEARPGAPFGGDLPSGGAVRIFTGGAVPAGADCVIMQEYATRDGDRVSFAPGHGPARHVRQEGHDFAVGDVLLRAGTRLEPRALVAVAGADCAHVTVGARPRVKLLATGDELEEPGTAASSPHGIPDSIAPALASLVGRGGGDVTQRARALDDLPALERQAGELLTDADLVVVTGGASVGERDFAKPMFAAHGLELVFAKVAIKPGKPVWLGRAGSTLVLGLPGNPTSALVTARLFLDPILARLQGGAGYHAWRRLPLAAALSANGNRESFVRARWDEAGLVPLSNQDSGVQGGLARADCLIRCAADQDQQSAGALVPALLL